MSRRRRAHPLRDNELPARRLNRTVPQRAASTPELCRQDRARVFNHADRKLHERAPSPNGSLKTLGVGSRVWCVSRLSPRVGFRVRSGTTPGWTLRRVGDKGRPATTVRNCRGRLLKKPSAGDRIMTLTVKVVPLLSFTAGLAKWLSTSMESVKKYGYRPFLLFWRDL